MPSLLQSFFKELGIFLDDTTGIRIRDHIPYDEHNIVDGEISIPDALLLVIESEVDTGQFDGNDQASRYFELLKERHERNRVLVLISPDTQEPDIVTLLPGQCDACHLLWRSWEYCAMASGLF